VELTPLGKILTARAREVLEVVEAAATDVERFQAGSIGRIDIGTFQSVSTALVPSMLGRLRAERPQLEARLLESDDEAELARRVIDGQLDVTFLLGAEPPELDIIELFVDPYVVVALPADVGPGPVPIARLQETPLIGQQDNACQRSIDKNLRFAGLEPDYVFQSNDNSAVIAMVRAGMGMAVLPLLAVEPDDPRIAVRPLDPAIPPRHVTIAWRRGRTLSPATERFIELAREMTADLRTCDLATAV
jgi:DNA-binding transcriptional LysR family regulator